MSLSVKPYDIIIGSGVGNALLDGAAARCPDLSKGQAMMVKDGFAKAAARIEQLARDRCERSLLSAAVRWELDMGVQIAIWGGRRPEQMAPIGEVDGWRIDDDFKRAVDDILKETIESPVGPEFIAPPETAG